MVQSQECTQLTAAVSAISERSASVTEAIAPHCFRRSKRFNAAQTSGNVGNVEISAAWIGANGNIQNTKYRIHVVSHHVVYDMTRAVVRASNTSYLCRGSYCCTLYFEKKSIISLRRSTPLHLNSAPAGATEEPHHSWHKAQNASSHISKVVSCRHHSNFADWAVANCL